MYSTTTGVAMLVSFPRNSDGTLKLSKMSNKIRKQYDMAYAKAATLYGGRTRKEVDGYIDAVMDERGVVGFVCS